MESPENNFAFSSSVKEEKSNPNVFAKVWLKIITFGSFTGTG